MAAKTSSAPEYTVAPEVAVEMRALSRDAQMALDKAGAALSALRRYAVEHGVNVVANAASDTETMVRPVGILYLAARVERAIGEEE